MWIIIQQKFSIASYSIFLQKKKVYISRLQNSSCRWLQPNCLKLLLIWCLQQGLVTWASYSSSWGSKISNWRPVHALGVVSSVECHCLALFKSHSWNRTYSFKWKCIEQQWKLSAPKSDLKVMHLMNFTLKANSIIFFHCIHWKWGHPDSSILLFSVLPGGWINSPASNLYWCKR